MIEHKAQHYKISIRIAKDVRKALEAYINLLEVWKSEDESPALSIAGLLHDFDTDLEILDDY